MTDLRKAAEDLLEVVEAAIKAGDWKVDGACDLDLAIVRLRQALSQPEPTVEDNSQNWKGMDGAVAWHLIDRHADNWADIGKMMDEWLKANQAQPEQWKTCRHCGFQYRPPKEDKWHPLSQPEEKMRIEGNGKLTTKPYPDGYESEQQFRQALAKREWVGLTDDEIEDAWIEASDEYDDTISINNLGRILEAKLKEKNGVL